MLKDFLLSLHIPQYLSFIICLIITFIACIGLLIRFIKLLIYLDGDGLCIAIVSVFVVFSIIIGACLVAVVGLSHEYQNMCRLAENGYELYIDGVNVDIENINLDDYAMENFTINDDSRKILIKN